jgi:low density lipoprotein receptor adapter protein 1
MDSVYIIGNNFIVSLFSRISFCSADKNHEKVFAFMARNSINETMECHAFLCAKRKIVSDI